MKYVLGIFSVIITISLIVIAWTNHTNLIELAVPFTNLVLVTNRFFYVAMIILMSFGSGLMLGLAILKHQTEKLAPYKRQLEKVSVMNDSSQSKVEVLEAKIKTLEAALKQSLENK